MQVRIERVMARGSPSPAPLSLLRRFLLLSLPGNLRYVLLMQVSETIQCPFCGQRFELVLDTSLATQRFTTDCEVCCRPFEVVAECTPGEILSLDAVAN